MKTKIFYLLATSCFVVFFSCQDSKKEKQITESNSLKLSKSIKDLENIKTEIDSLLQLDPESSLNKFVNESKRFDHGGIMVSKISALTDIFDPEKHPCPLPEKIKKKLIDSKKQGKPWAPDFIKAYISKLPDSVIKLPRQSISHILHWITVKRKSNGTSFRWLVSKAPTYNNFRVEDFVLSGVSSFFYSLDCSGYLNAAIEASATVPGNDIRTKAKSALETQKSIFIGGGIIISPLSAAYYANIPIDTFTRIKILSSILETPDILDDDTIRMNLSYDAIWASKNGNSSFNGNAELKAGGGVGLGFVQVSGSSAVEGSISRKSSFSDFDTYITGESILDHPKEITVGQVKALLQRLKAGR